MPPSRHDGPESDPPAPRAIDVFRGMWVPVAYAILSLVAAFLVVGRPDILRMLALRSGGPLGVQSFTALLTHPFVPTGLANWAVPLVYIVAASYLLRRELTDGQQLLLAVAAAVAGGAAYEIFTTPPDRYLVGGMIVAWGFCGAAFLFGALRWRSLPWPWRAYTVLMGIFVIVRAFDIRPPQSGMSVAALADVLLVAAWLARNRRTRPRRTTSSGA